MASGKKGFRITFNAPVTLSFVGLSFIVTLVGFLTHDESTKLLFMTYRGSFLNPLTYLRLFTHVLGHMGFEHWLGTMAYLLILGPLLEEKYGSKSLIIAIVVTAFSTAVVNLIFFPNVMLCGASGVVFAFILLSSFTGFKKGERPLTFILVAVFYIGQQIYQGLAYDDNISNMAHIGGGIVGGVLGFVLNRNNR